MAPDTLSDQVHVRDGVIVGPIRHFANSSRDAASSIHDKATAARLRFRGGSVTGSIHLNLLPLYQ